MNTFASSALQLHSPLDSLAQSGNNWTSGIDVVNRRANYPDGPPTVLEGQAFLHRLASADLVNTYFRGPLDRDNLTGETWEMRLAYRELLLKEPAVKAALISKVQTVAALDPQMQPDDPDRPVDKAAAKFVDWSIQRSYGGWPRLIENILLPSLIDGFSICEKGIKVTRSQKYGAFWTLEKLYSLDTRYIKFDVDRFKEIKNIRLTTTMPASALNPKDFVIFQHLQLFESPFGISDLRAAYRAAKLIESAIKLRGILLENFSGPFLTGLYAPGAQDQKQNLESVLAKARSLGWVVAPVGSKIDVVNLATSAPDQFQSCIEDLRKEIYTAIRGAYLPFTEAGSGVQRADTGVQKSITEIFEWWLAGAVCEVINRQVIPDLIEWNYGDTAGLPRCQLGGMNLERASKQLDMIDRVNKMTGNVSKKQVYDLSRIEPATDDDDRLPPQGQGAMPGGPPGMGGAPGMPAPGAEGPPISPDSANPQPAGMGPEQQPDPDQKFLDENTHPVRYVGSKYELTQPAPAGWPPAGDLEGRKLAAILQPSIDSTAKIIANATKAGLHTSIPNYASNGIWTPDDRKAVVESFAVLLAIGDMLARARLRQHQPSVVVRKFADTSAAFDLFGKSGDTPFSFLDRPIRPPSHVELAIEYIKSLVPIPGVDALFMAEGWRRRAFTLALDCESVILDKVKNAVVGELFEGDNATADIQMILDAAGVSPRNPQYAEMVCRTNVMDSYNTGFHSTMQDAQVQSDFPVWQYCGIDDGRQGADHDPQFNHYFLASDDFATVRGPRVYNCRCLPRPIYKKQWAKLEAGGAQLGPYPEWVTAATALFADISSNALTPANRLGSLLCVAAELRDEIRPERLRIILSHLADDSTAYARAIGVPPPPTRIFHGVYDESKHPRDDHGLWVDKADIASARVNSGKASELRARVTKPAERAKLDAALGSNEPIATPPDKAKGKRIIAKARLGQATPQEQRDLFHHLPAISHEDLRDVRDAVESQPSQQTAGAIEQRGLLTDHVRAAAAGEPGAAMPEHPVFAAVKSEASKSDLPASKKTQYAARMDHVLRTMPVAAQDRIATNLNGIGFHADNKAVATAAVASALDRDFLSDNERQRITNFSEASKKGKLKPAAAYLPKVGMLHVNGGDDSTYAHILGHAIDGPKKEISSSPAWERAWNAEIAGKLSQEPRLNRYAQGNPHEGFAEFSRLVYGTENSAADIEAKFPLSAAVLKSHGLWDDTPRFHAEAQAAPPLEEGGANPPGSIDRQGYDRNGVRGGEGRKLPSTASWAEEPADVKLPDAFQERVALDSDPGGAHIDTLAPTHAPATGTPANPENQHVYTVPTKSLHVDPHLFQYKVAGIGAEGVTNKLSKVTQWDHNLGGVSLVWRDPASGKDYIVNGHHRKELADRVGQPTLNVRYITAKDSTEARSIGAMANMAEGNGKAIDAAKWMRDTKKDIGYLKAKGVPITGKLITDANALVNLGPKSFDAVAQGRLDEDTAVAVAKHLKDPELQDALFQKIRAREAAGNDWTPRQIETAARKLASSGTAKIQNGGDLFGDVEGEQSTFDQEVDLEDFANRKLAQQITDYGAVGNKDRAGRVADAGNTLNLSENAKRRKEAGDLQENFEKFARLKSNTSATVREYAAKLAAIGEHGSYVKKNDVRSEFYDKLKQAIGDDLAGKPAPTDAGSLGADRQSSSGTSAAGGDGAPAGSDSAAGGVPAPAGAGEEIKPTTEPDHGEEARQAGISTLLGSQGPADKAAEGESPAGADGVQRDVGSGEGSKTALGRDGDQPAGSTKADEPLAAQGKPDEPITTRLHGDDAKIDLETQHRAREKYDQFRADYLKKGMGTLDADGTLRNVTLNTDEWRDIFPEYKGTNAHAVHEASSDANKKLFFEALKETAGKGNGKMLILAGGGGSGKGSAVKDHIALADYPLTLDQVSDNYKKLQAKMDEAKAAGFNPQFVFIDRHPADAWTHGVVKRAANARGRGEIARTVPLEVALQANLEARRTALKLLQENPDADATVIDNNRGFGEARLIEDRNEAIQFLKDQDSSHNYEELHGRLQNDTLDLHESGGLPADLAEGLVGREAIHARRAQSGQPETERAGGPDDATAEDTAAGAGTEGDGAGSAVPGSQGPSGGEDLASTSDKKLRRHRPESEALKSGESGVSGPPSPNGGDKPPESSVSAETLGSGYKPVGDSDWHKGPSGELVHAPTLDGARKSKRKPKTKKGTASGDNQKPDAQSPTQEVSTDAKAGGAGASPNVGGVGQPSGSSESTGTAAEAGTIAKAPQSGQAPEAKPRASDADAEPANKQDALALAIGRGIDERHFGSKDAANTARSASGYPEHPGNKLNDLPLKERIAKRESQGHNESVVQWGSAASEHAANMRREAIGSKITGPTGEVGKVVDWGFDPSGGDAPIIEYPNGEKDKINIAQLTSGKYKIASEKAGEVTAPTPEAAKEPLPGPTGMPAKKETLASEPDSSESEPRGFDQDYNKPQTGEPFEQTLWRSPNKGGATHESGAFYATDPAGAARYSRGVGINAQIGEKIRLNNPLVVGDKESAARDLGIDTDSLPRPDDSQDIDHHLDIALAEAAKEDGHDGIIYNNSLHGEPEIHAFNPPKLESGDIPEHTVQGRKKEKANPHISLANTLAERLKSGDKLTTPEVFKLANEAHGGTRAEGKYHQSAAYDSLETAVNLSLKGETNPTADLASAKEQAQKLADMVKRLPTQTNRTGNKDDFQQFSTPPHYSFAATWVANLRPGETVLEPSAGTGSIAIHAQNAGAKVITNELDPQRADLLAHQFGAENGHRENAEQISKILPKRGVNPDVVVMNPPFSATAGRTSKKDLLTAAKHIDEALRMLPEGGRLVAIVGQGMTNLKSTYKDWFSKITQKYGLKANVGVSGDEYAKYGTNFGTRLLVIDKDGPTKETVTGDAGSVPELMEKLEGVRNGRPNNVPTGTTEQAASQPAGKENSQRPGTADAGQQPVPGSTPDGVAQSDETGRRRGGRRSEQAQPSVDPNVAAATPSGTDADGGQRGSARGNELSAEPASDAGDFVSAGTDRGNAASQPDAGSGGGSAGGAAERQSGSRVSGVRKPAPLAIRVASPDEQKQSTALRVPQANADTADGASVSEDSLYESYQPSKLRIDGAHPHPAALVESSAMSSIEPPTPTYSPTFHPDIVEKGLLSAAALESVVYAGQNHETFLEAIEGEQPARRGYFVGDGTGAGKGRQIAGVILDNMNQGRKKAVWMSKNFDLLEDAKRDWRDLGNDPNDINEFKKLKTKNPQQDGITFVSYNTLKGKPKNDKNAPTNLETLVNWLGKDFDGVIAFDESHMMANAIGTKGARGKKKPSQRALAGIELQKRLPNARVLYVSATGATEVSNLAYAERLGLWGKGTAFADKQQFIGEMDRGGVAAMEAVAQSAKAQGLYCSRSLAMDDGTPHGKVEYDRITHQLTPDQREMYDAAADGWQHVLKNIDKAIEDSGADSQSKSAAYSQFWGSQQRFFNQMMTAMQTESVIKDMEHQIASGNAPVVQLVNTMEAATNRALDRMEEDQEYEDIDVSPKDILMEYLNKSFPTQVFEDQEDADGNTVRVPVKDSEGNLVEDPALVAMRDELLDKVGALRIPESPLDRIINHFGHEHVAECTGRTNRLISRVQENGERRITRDVRPGNSNTTEAKAFQNGEKKIMIFSDAGGTGRSYHADKMVKNQSRRVHYMLQPGWRADNAVQGLGRTHRTNQSSAPLFRLVEIGDLKAQRRFISTIARRLDQLGALTRGQRQAGSSGLFKASDNLESKEASKALRRFFSDLSGGQIAGLNYRETMSEMGFRPDESGQFDTDKITMGQFLNRLLSIKVDKQNNVFDHFEHRLNQTVEEAIAAGDLDAGVENYKAASIAKVNDRPIHREERTGAEARLLTTKVKRKLEKNSFQNTRGGTLPLGYVKSNRNGTVYAMYKSSDRTDAATGKVSSVYRLKSVSNGVGEIRPTNTIDAARYSQYGEAGNWKHLSQDEAEKLWKEQYAKAPDFEETTQHFVTGAILPIWDKLPKSDRPKIYKVKLDDGTQTVGRHVPDGAIFEAFAKSMGFDPAGGEAKKHNSDDVHEAVASGTHRAELANGWKLVPAGVQGERRIELIGPGPAHFSELQREGVNKERIAYNTRWFIPVSDEGKRILRSITSNRPIVKVMKAKES